MKRTDLEELEAMLMKFVVNRRQLGAFDTNAEAILICLESLLKITQHMKDQAPREKLKK